MEIIVQKFGGSSVADTEKLYKVCKHIINQKKDGKEIVVVVSAQGKMTDRLIEEEQEITRNRIDREHDVLISAGEQITASKLAMCLKEQGYNAISYLGWQIPIITDEKYGDANIIKIGTRKIYKQLKLGNIVVVAGFQGIDRNKNITTLGRGGSDTTAIALSAALKAEKCEIYTDVDGVYTEDPNQSNNAKKIEKITYEKMLEMSNSGAKVLHNKCIKLAQEKNIKIIVKSTFIDDSIGTIVEN